MSIIDLLNTKKNEITKLSHSYFLITVTTQKGLEPSTFAVTGRRSNQLSHWAIRLYEGFMYLQNIIQKVLSNHFSILWSSPRPISTSQLHALLHFHPKPINLVVFKGSYSYDGISYLEGGFTLRCLQRLSLPDLATLL